jgi:hypothetical protein
MPMIGNTVAALCYISCWPSGIGHQGLAAIAGPGPHMEIPSNQFVLTRIRAPLNG